MVLFSSLSLKDVYLVKLDFVDSSTQEHLISLENVDAFIKASMRLHYRPGFNPHNGGKTSQIKQIHISRLDEEGPYWWSCPDLQQPKVDDDFSLVPGGAVLLRWAPYRVINPKDYDEEEFSWLSPKFRPTIAA